MGQGDSAEDFDPSESMENAGILDIFPIFILHDRGKRSAEARSSHCAVMPKEKGTAGRRSAAGLIG